MPARRKKNIRPGVKLKIDRSMASVPFDFSKPEWGAGEYVSIAIGLLGLVLLIVLYLVLTAKPAEAAVVDPSSSAVVPVADPAVDPNVATPAPAVAVTAKPRKRSSHRAATKHKTANTPHPKKAKKWNPCEYGRDAKGRCRSKHARKASRA